MAGDESRCHVVEEFLGDPQGVELSAVRVPLPSAYDALELTPKSA